ncbi:hypothetical protein [Tenacibaculum haliotis]|uniref:hypothetical protein n=1 Tax=Tenacibaculum haliotis TaxID=1888914 RepID=UPI0021AEF8D1|nr:hypothetical protein [Tenacibaculum haliotis]MCT4699087.1 hypothetical protein [Tenacibaculum haliotis]
MRKILCLLSLVMAISCSDNTTINGCFNDVNMNTIIDSSLSEHNISPYNLLVPGGHSISFIEGRKVLISNLGNNNYRAFDLQCPSKDCTSPMEFNGLKLTCPCNKEQYSSLSGCLINSKGECVDNSSCSALMYFVTYLGNSKLRISI